MLRVFRDLFDSVLAPPEPTPEQREAHLQLAVAVLVVEVMRADPRNGAAARQAAIDAVRGHFSLDEERARELVALAQETSRSANDYFQFTSAINDSVGQDDKVKIVESLWRVAYADGTLDAQENHVIWRLADLLHVPHGQYIAAKMHAQEGGG